MFLIADGGSTKCDWVLLGESGEEVFKTRTKGLNPAIISEEELFSRIRGNQDLEELFNKSISLDFYGAGCGTATPRKILHNVLSELFQSSKVNVEEDMVAAVYAVTSEPGIVCIFGTGSNSCYYDGKTVKTAVESLGYLLMDEASGNYFGKKLIRDYFYKKMPEELAQSFEENYELEPDTIKLNIYKKPNPNVYLASFAEFLFKRKEEHAYFTEMIKDGVREFIEYRILCYENSRELPVHFIGSIAYFSQDIIRECLDEYQLTSGSFVRRPIDGLIKFYKENKIKKE